MVIRGVVFDLDDTLYDERDYVRSGFEAVGRAVTADVVAASAVSDWLWAEFEAGVRGDAFDRLRMAFPSIAREYSTAALVEVYRTHHPAIALASGVAEAIDGLRRHGLRLGLVTDGPVASQTAKVVALGLDRWFDPIVLTWALGPAAHKPATPAFEAIQAAWSLPGPALAYVADNPAKDFVGPRALGWLTVRLSRPTQLRHGLQPVDEAHRPDIVVASAVELLALGLDTGARIP